MSSLGYSIAFILGISLRIGVALLALTILKLLYNISPFHPLSRYPGPLHFRATQLFASYYHASGTLFQKIEAAHERYGPTVRIAPNELSFTNPSAWPQIYNTRPQLPKSEFHFAVSDKAELPTSMITANDAEHTRLRRLAGPAFLNSAVLEVEPVLQRYVNQLCEQLTVVSKETAGKSQNICEWLLFALNDVIGQLALDQEFECLEKKRMHPWPAFLLGALKRTAALNQFRRFGFNLRWLQPLLSEKAKAEMEAFFSTAKIAIDRRLAREKAESAEDIQGDKKRPDIVGLMLRDVKGGEKVSDAEITSNSILIVGGGAETTSTCLSGTLFHLCKTPRVMKKLRKEVRARFGSVEEITLKAVAEMAYVKAVVDEGLRMFPVASYIAPRVTPEGGCVIDGEVVPGGTHVSMGQWGMGRSEHLFDDAKEFRPERWLDLEVQKVSGRRVDDILKPFSMGPRNCIGKALALAEARLVLTKLVWHFDMELDGDHATWVRDARFYILWQLQPLKLRLTPVR